MKTVRCYNCGKVLKKNETTKEHIPARTLYEGYGSDYKMNRITVPACFDCNNQYSTTDEEFRNMIGVISNRDENSKITDKSVKSITNGSGKSRLWFDVWGRVSGVEFKQPSIVDFHKKNFKGLFYHQYGLPLPDNYTLLVNIDEDDWSAGTMSIICYLKTHFNSKHSGHPDILTYWLQPLRDGLNSTDKKDLEYNKEENIYVCLLKYNRTHAALVVAVRNDYLETIKRNKEAKSIIV